MNETDPLLKTSPAITSSLTTLAASSAPDTWEMVQAGGVVLENSGSTARDHLANERTFLAWIRTALALVGVGIGLLKITTISNVAGYSVIVLGVFTLLNASWRYFHVMRLMMEGKFQPNVVSILTMVTMILGVVVLFVYLSLTDNLIRSQQEGSN